GCPKNGPGMVALTHGYRGPRGNARGRSSGDPEEFAPCARRSDQPSCLTETGHPTSPRPGTQACRALTTSNITAPALFRTIEQCGPTLLTDESDTFAAENGELRGVINSGHTRLAGSGAHQRHAGADRPAVEMMVHQPQSVVPQPNFVPVMPSTSRSSNS